MAQTEDFRFVVDNSDAGVRLDTYLSLKVEELTRSQIKKLIREHLIVLNQVPSKPSVRLSEGDLITGYIPPPRRLDVIPEDIQRVLEPVAGHRVQAATGAVADTRTLVAAIATHVDSVSHTA